MAVARTSKEERIMLVLTRRIGEEIVIGSGIRVRILAITGRGVRLGITAAPSISVHREEVHARRCAEHAASATLSSSRRQGEPVSD